MTKNEFIFLRTQIISNMLDSPDKLGIYPTTKCYAKLDDLYDKITGSTGDPSWSQSYENGTDNDRKAMLKDIGVEGTNQA